MQEHRGAKRRAITASTAVAVAVVLGTTGLAWGTTDIGRAGVVARQEAGGSAGDAFVAIQPVRILDTRGPENGPIGVERAGPLTGGEQIDLPLTTSAPNARSTPLPADATAVLINVTIDGDATEKSFVTVWPQGTPRPFASADNAEPGLVTPNLTLAKLGPTGGISIYTQQGAINLAIDLVGYTLPPPDAPSIAGVLLIGEGRPSAETGVPGTFYLVADTQELYGPKGEDGTWPGPAPLPTWASPAAIAQGTDDSDVTMDAGPDNGGLHFGPDKTVWTVTGLITPADYLLDASVEVRPTSLPGDDATVQCGWSNRPTRVFSVTLPLSSAVDLDQVTGTITVPGSITDGTTADLVCRTGSVGVQGALIDVQAIQVNAHRVNLLDNG